MKILLATHYGMCFGVRDALRATHNAAKAAPVTILGQLVHNPVVDQHLRTLGVKQGALEGAPAAETQHVVITAHGASNRQRQEWQGAGYVVTDTTCPLVRKAHDCLASLVEAGYAPVVIGEAGHTEVKGLTGDFAGASVVLTEEHVQHLPFSAKIGVISQTTQPLLRVLGLVEKIKARHPGAEVRYMDTVCHPTKQRQAALEDLCRQCQVLIVVGGKNSNNTRQLVESARRLGVEAHQVERANEVDGEWIARRECVGVTAGTSTLDETVRAVVDQIEKLHRDQSSRSVLESLIAVGRRS